MLSAQIAPLPAARNQAVLTLALLLTALAGLTIRSKANTVPALLASYAPDTLWTLLVFLLVLTASPRLATFKAALIALGFAYFIECTQLYHAPWIDSLRANRIGGLILGFGFLWSDIACYTLGITLGTLLDRLIFASPETRELH